MDNASERHEGSQSPLEPAVVRLFSFRAGGHPAELDAALRDVVVPRLAALPGLRRVHVGRRGADESGERTIATVWASMADMEATVGQVPPGDVSAAEFDVPIVEPRVEVLPVVVEAWSEPGRLPQILRIFRGEVRDGELDAYAEDVRGGALADMADGRGAIALFLAAAGRSHFVTVSVWAGWDDIAAATGGNVRQPIATRQPERLVSGTATHFEVLPETAPRA